MQELILKASRELMGKEGLENISIRKIASLIEYSPAIIYHYFKNKDRIIETLIAEDYQKLRKALSPLQSSEKTPEEKIRESTARYISTAVRMGDFYRSMMLNPSQRVLAHTSVLQKGASVERPPVAMLCGVIRQFPALRGKSNEEIERTAQVIWSTIFGLSVRLIVENVDEQQKRLLIAKVSDWILQALKNDSLQGKGD